MLENGQLSTLNMKDILPNRFQPRIHFDEVKLNELAESIRKYGLIQPIIVRQIGTKYEIIAGERRFKASTLANKETIPAIIVNLSDRDSEEIALLENIQREDLTPIEEAVSYKRILDAGYITQEELAKKIGKSQSAIANKIRLLNLDDTVQDALLNGKISERHARSLLKIHKLDDQVTMLNRIISERLTVKMTDKEIEKLLNSDEGEVKIKAKQPIELLELEEPKKPAKPVASHKIIKVSPPPGFEDKIKSKVNERGKNMDIDKILEEAQDITTQEPKPEADMQSLMQQNPETVTSPLIQSETPEAPAPVMEPGKFVSPVVEQPQVQEATEEVNQVDQQGVNFDSIFGQAPAPVVPEMTQAVPEPFGQAPAMETQPVMPEAPTPVVPEAPVQNIPDDTIIEPTQGPKNEVINFKSAIDLIRNCSSEIEKMGYYVDVDEIDLGTSYQVTFKIEKQ